MSDEPQYTEASIRSLKGLEPVRHRATAYIPDTEAGGLTHQARELIDNALDELVQMARSITRQGFLRVTFCKDISRGTFQLIIHDNARGIPLGKLVELVTTLHSSGKFDTLAYKTSAGLFGVGLTVAAGLSKYIRVVTYRPDGTASMLVTEGNYDPESIRASATSNTGVTIIYEPDPTIFTGLPEYADAGYLGLLELLKKYVFFKKYSIEFRLSTIAAPATVWTCPIETFSTTIDNIEQQAEILWNTEQHDGIEWVRHYWHIIRPFAWEYEYQKTLPADDDLQSYHIRLFYVKTEQKGDSFGLINNIPIDNPTSNHISVVYDVLLRSIADRISDAPMRKFVLDSYRLPIFIAVDVKYSGAQPAGTTKHAFTSAAFREAYRPEIVTHFASPAGIKAISELFALLESEINTRYMQSLSGLGKSKASLNRLFLSLERPGKFKDANTKDRSLAELFLVEGTSAGGSVGYDTELQGIYRLSGKPKNVIARGVDHREMMRQILANDIYKDIFRIINFDPLKPDLSALNYGRCFLFPDGDAHGQHIAAIMMGTMWVAAPSLVQSGFFGIVAPPYYEVWVGKRKVSSTYVREKKDLIQWKATNIYNRELAIDIVYHYQEQQSRVRLNYEQMLLLASVVSDVGLAIENLSNEFSLPGLLVEALTQVTYYLSPQTMDVNIIRDVIDANRVEYNAPINTLIVSIGREDYVIPLFYIQERICNQVSSILQRIRWRSWDIVVTSRRNSEMQNVAMSIYQLYELFKYMDRMVTVKVLKGIGSMESEDAARACMDARNRRVYNITEPGDVDVIFDLLGDNPQTRKDLMLSPPLTDYRRI